MSCVATYVEPRPLQHQKLSCQSTIIKLTVLLAFRRAYKVGHLLHNVPDYLMKNDKREKKMQRKNTVGFSIDDMNISAV
jgi:hypothetical protein